MPGLELAPSMDKKSKKSKRKSDSHSDDASELKSKKIKKSQKETTDLEASDDKESKKEKKKSSKKSKKEKSDESKKKKKSKKSDESIEIEEPVMEPIEDSAIEEAGETNDIPVNERLSTHNLSPSTLASLAARGVTRLFPIQAASFDPIMKGHDLLGRARTGTGKTLAFSLPMVETLKRDRKQEMAAFNQRGRAPRILIMAPTRELAIQVHREFDSISSGELKSVCVYGGVPYDSQCKNYFQSIPDQCRHCPSRRN